MVTRTIFGVNPEREGIAFALIFKVPSDDFDLKNAVRKACRAFCRTEEGKRQYEANGNQMTWEQFYEQVPDYLCKLFGFEKVKEKAEYTKGDADLLETEEALPRSETQSEQHWIDGGRLEVWEDNYGRKQEVGAGRSI